MPTAIHHAGRLPATDIGVPPGVGSRFTVGMHGTAGTSGEAVEPVATPFGLRPGSLLGDDEGIDPRGDGIPSEAFSAANRLASA